MPPADIYIDPHGDDDTGLVVVTQPEWAILGGWIFKARTWMRDAGPCLGKPRNDSSDIPASNNGVMEGQQ